VTEGDTVTWTDRRGTAQIGRVVAFRPEGREVKVDLGGGAFVWVARRALRLVEVEA
jgi:hypothetical protein